MESDYSRPELRSYTTEGLSFVDCCSRGRHLEEAVGHLEHNPGTGRPCSNEIDEKGESLGNR